MKPSSASSPSTPRRQTHLIESGTELGLQARRADDIESRRGISEGDAERNGRYETDCDSDNAKEAREHGNVPVLDAWFCKYCPVRYIDQAHVSSEEADAGSAACFLPDDVVRQARSSKENQ